MTRNSLPPEFADLEKYVEVWARPTVDERIDARWGNSMENIREFYDAAIERAPAMLDYLDRFPLHDMPQDVGRLIQLLLGLAQSSIAVEIQGQPLPPKTSYPLAVRLVAGVAPYG